MVESVKITCKVMPEIVAYVDEDDKESFIVAKELKLITVVGPKLIFSDYWNKCYEKASGDILMMAADDLIFKTPYWDAIVEDTFKKYPDHIVLVHGNDTFNELQIASYPFLHRRWAEVVGYFSPPYFSSGGCDVWLNAIAKFVDRRQGIPIYLEQLDGIKEDIVIGISEQYRDLISERLADAAKLQDAIAEFSAY